MSAPSELESESLRLLDATVHAHGGSIRTGQRQVTQSIAKMLAGAWEDPSIQPKLDDGEPRPPIDLAGDGAPLYLIVDAGTGTGKTYGYLSVALSIPNKRVLISVAGIALQEQLLTKDLPAVTKVVAKTTGRRPTFTMLKGISNYACMAKASETRVEISTVQGSLLGDNEQGDTDHGDGLPDLLEWVLDGGTATGDMSEAPAGVTDDLWRQVSTTSTECPGSKACDFGEECFGMQARARAKAADVVVVNAHLLAAVMGVDGEGMFGDYDLLIVDECHELEEVARQMLGVSVSPGRVRAIARATRAVVSDNKQVTNLLKLADGYEEVLRKLEGERLHGGCTDRPELGTLLASISQGIATLDGAVRNAAASARNANLTGKAIRHQKALDGLRVDIDKVLDGNTDYNVIWVEGGNGQPRLQVAPINVAPTLRRDLWSRTPAILTSATVPSNLVWSLGLPRKRTEKIKAASPFDYPSQAALYVPSTMPIYKARSSAWDEAVTAHVRDLVTLTGGGALVLFTSYRALNLTFEALGSDLPYKLLKQGDAPKTRLVQEFAADTDSILLATQSFWTGVDVQGAACRAVIIDKLPFPSPVDPVFQARRELAGDEWAPIPSAKAKGSLKKSFLSVDLPYCATLLSQGVGRLIRSEKDVGIVAVLDNRLADKEYRHLILDQMPQFRRLRDLGSLERWWAAANAEHGAVR